MLAATVGWEDRRVMSSGWPSDIVCSEFARGSVAFTMGELCGPSGGREGSDVEAMIGSFCTAGASSPHFVLRIFWGRIR
jgi:hypothetical protein